MPKIAEVGSPVRYVDEFGGAHNAIVTANWGGTPESSINLVYVSSDEAKTDSYGRQIERVTSVVPRANQSAHGRYFEIPE